jgi:hypothetical protein
LMRTELLDVIVTAVYRHGYNERSSSMSLLKAGKPRSGGCVRGIFVDDSSVISYNGVVLKGKRCGGGKKSENGKQNLHPESVKPDHELWINPLLL